jgi:hypothetical protein
MRVILKVTFSKREGFFIFKRKRENKVSLTPILQRLQNNMIQDLEQYRNRREVTKAPIISGANALKLQPLVEMTPQLRVITELPAPIQIDSFLKRKVEPLAEIPNTPEVLARQQIINDTAEAEPERFIEREIDPDKPWSAFGQVMFIKEHIIDGKSVKKIAAISMAYPGGVGTRMAGEVLSETIGINQSEFVSWKGQSEGGIIAASKEVQNITDQFGLMDDFIQNSGSVIKNRHAQGEHEVVQHFFGLQDTRKEFLDTVKEDAAAILENPNFTSRSAFDERYKDKGIYLIEGIVVDGVWEGGDPQGKRMRLVDMAADDAHLKWLQWAEKTATEMKGDGVIVDAEDTETVTDCGGNKGCSEFFEKMEGSTSEPTIDLNRYSVSTGIAGSIAASAYSKSQISGGGAPAYDSENCSSCGKERYKEDGCKCSTN